MTVFLDDELARRLSEEAQKRGTTFDETLNAVIRERLSDSGQAADADRRFHVRPRAMGLRTGLCSDTVSGLIAHGEGEGSR